MIRSLLRRSHATGQSRVGEGLLGDLEAASGEWGFAPAEVKTPVTMWQGTEDTLTPEARNVRLLKDLPKAEMKKFPGEGHFLLYRHEVELLRE